MNIKTLRKLSFATLIAGTAVISGCANFGLGNPEYACSGIPEMTDQGGIKCASAREVYELSEQPGPVVINKSEEQLELEEKNNKDWWGDSKSSSDQENQPVKMTNAQLSVDNNDPLAAAQINNDPIPIRSRAKIMRIWIAPWESTSGDLNVSGLIFTELESRRWSVGVQEDVKAPTLTPLQSIQRKEEN